MRTTSLFSIPVIVSALIAAACSGSGNSSPAETATPVVVTRWAVQTGFEPVDRFLDLMAADDTATIANQTAYRAVECERVDPSIADGPFLACRDGEPEGSVSNVITVGCFPSHALRQDEMPGRLAWLGDDGMTLEAVFELDESATKYALQFIERGTPPAPAYTRTVVYLTDDGRLTGYASCGEFTEPRAPAEGIWP